MTRGSRRRSARFPSSTSPARRTAPRAGFRRGCSWPRCGAGTCRPSAGPTEAAFINAPEAEAGWRAVVAGGEDSRWRGGVLARWLLGPSFNPGRHAPGLHCPWLVCVGGADRVARPAVAIAAARSAPRGELHVYPGVDHFDVYDGPEHEAGIADQLAFLDRHVLG